MLVVIFSIRPDSAFAHAKGEDYVFINVLKQSIEGEFQVNADDLREKLNYDISDTGEESIAKIRSNLSVLSEYIINNFSITPENGTTPYSIQFLDSGPEEAVEGFIRYPFRIEFDEAPTALSVHHNMYYQNDKTHRGLLLLQYNVVTDKNYGEEHTALLFSPSNQTQRLDLTQVSGLVGKKQMLKEGVWHIWIGIDHILFLVALLLPIVLLRAQNKWTPANSFFLSARKLLGVVTIFTIAHSITLLLAALDFIQLNSQLVESIIALSIILVALNNIFQWYQRGSIAIIFFLGLFHGLGFASVMGNLPFRMIDLTKMVVLFNIGVEVGQVAIVLVLFPLLYYVRASRFYVPVILNGGSALLVFIGGYWFIQRAFG